jgi:hypothetical protein
MTKTQEELPKLYHRDVSKKIKVVTMARLKPPKTDGVCLTKM